MNPYIELGDFYIISATSLEDVLWLIIGLVVLASMTTTFLYWNRRNKPDPFV